MHFRWSNPTNFLNAGGTLEIEADGSVGYYSGVTIESGANFINQ